MDDEVDGALGVGQGRHDRGAVSDYGKTAEQTVQPSLVGFRIAVWTGEVPLGGRLLLAYTRDHEGGPTHFVGHAVLQEVQADRLHELYGVLHEAHLAAPVRGE